MGQGSILQKVQVLVLIPLLSFVLSCCNFNLFSEFAQEDTEAALFMAAKLYINKGQWDKAIASLEIMSGEFLAKREVARIHASAYAGRCGLDLLALVENLSKTSSSSLFQLLMAQHKSVTTDQREDCQQAETIIKGISNDLAQRTIDENILMIFVSLTKVGVILNAHADSDDSNGEPDSGWDACADNADNLPEASAREVGAGMGTALVNLEAISEKTKIGSGQTSALTDICDTLEGLNPDFDFCSITDPSSYSEDQVKGIRSIIQSKEVGLGTCDDILENCLCS